MDKASGGMGEDRNARGRGMENRCGIPTILIFLLLLITSCATPSVNFQGYKPQNGKLPLKAAIIISDELKKRSIETTIFAKCIELHDGKDKWRIFTNKTMTAQNDIGIAVEKLLVEGSLHLFDKVDVYNNKSLIPNRREYDVIVIPDILIKTGYDKNGALKREAYGSAHTTGLTDFEVNARAVIHWTVISSENESILVELEGSGFDSNPRCGAEYCGRGPLYRCYNKAIGNAMSAVFNELIGIADTKLAMIAKEKSERLALPANLIATVKYLDKDSLMPIESIYAGEESIISVTVTNQGKGEGFATKLLVEADSKNLKFQKEYELGDIQLGGSKEVQVPVKADLDLPDGKVNFIFKVTEKRNYDAKPVVMRVATNHIDRPKLAIASYEINDGRTGMANGNGNGIPENGETVEVTAFINNTGAGDAKGVKLILQEINSGIEIEQREVSIGSIAPNQKAKGKIVFTIPRTYAGKGITCKLAVSDIRLGQDATKEIALSFEQKRPILAYTSRILSRGTEIAGSANGETVDLEITPRNDGAIPARNLQITIAASSISYTPESKSIREILPGSAGTPQRFEIPIPRSYLKTELPVQIALKQADFEGKDDTIAIPVKVKAPKLTYTAIISGKHGGNTVEQNEGASLDVQIQNTGDLEAKDVRVSLNIPNPEIRLKGEKEIIIPVIPAKGFSETIKYEFFVFRKVQAGDLPVQINLSQADFPAVNFAHKLLVKAESTEVIEIAGSDQKKYSGIPSSTKQMGPVMAIARPATGTRVYEQSIDLMGTVADARGIDTIRVEVNGRPARVTVGDTSDINKKHFSATLPLIAGENRIRVIARNKDNISVEETTLVYRIEASAGASVNPPLSIFSDIDAQILSAPLSKKPDGKKWAVVIGVEDYRSAPAVPYARRDAQAFKEHLTRRLNVPEENIFILLDKDALLSEFRDILLDRLPARVNSGDTVYFYFAGHGVPDIGNRNPYLLPYDGKPTNPKISVLPASELYESLGQLKAENVFVFLDSCFSGAGRSAEEQQMLIADARIAGFKVNDPVLKQKNIIVMSATETNQVSNAYKDKQHGLFTYFLLKGMVENKGPVKIDDLYGYLKQTVPDLAVKEYGPNRWQNPTLKGLRVSENPLIMERAQ